MNDPVDVEPMDDGKKNSAVIGSSSEESTVMMDVAGAACVWNGQEFPEGSMVRSGGKVYECAFGRWVQS
jgi:hypothetical protein